MATKHGGLGRGLGALISDENSSTPVLAKSSALAPTPARPASSTGAMKVPVQKIKKNRLQPRHEFHEEAMTELTESIKTRGVIQPLLVRPSEDGYELIAGERRLRASIAAGLTEVPVIIMAAQDNDALVLALIENLQRENLNVLEEAEGYEVLAKRFNFTQEQVAEKVGKARASVTNTMRILSLPSETKQLIASGRISTGHAKLLAGLEIPEEQNLYAKRVVNENLSVRNLEKLIQKSRRGKKKARATRDDIPASHLTYLSDRLHRHFGTSVKITPSKTLANGKKVPGCLQVDFYSSEDLDRILDVLGISEE